MNKFLLTLLLSATQILAPNLAHAGVSFNRKVDGSFIPGKWSATNHVKNPFCDVDKKDLGIVSPGTDTTVAVGTSLDGLHSCDITPGTSGDKVFWSTNTLEVGGDCDAVVKWKGDASKWKAYLADGSGTKLSADYTLSDASTAPGTIKEIVLNYHVCTSGARVYLELVTSGGATPKFGFYYGKSLTVGSAWADVVMTDKGTMTITGTTSNPTKGTIAVDKVWAGTRSGYGKFRYEYRQTASGANGSGDYLFALPTGYTFDSSKVTYYTGVEGVGGWITNSSLGSATFFSSVSGVGVVIPYDSTHFRLFGIYNSSGGGDGGAIGSAFFQLGQTVAGFTADFEAPILEGGPQPFTRMDQVLMQGSVRWTTTTGASAVIGTAAWTSFSDADFATNRTNSGACTTNSSSNISCKISSLKAGKYKVTANGFMYAQPTVNGGTSVCNFAVYDGTNRRAVSTAYVSGVASNTPSDSVSTLAGVFEYSADQTNIEFIVQGYAETSNTQCGLGADGSSRGYEFLIEPLTQNAPASLVVGGVTSVDAGLTNRLEIINTVVSKSADYTATADEETIRMDNSGAARTISLPAAASVKGKRYLLQATSNSNYVTVDPNASETICGQTTVKLLGAEDAMEIYSDGTNWKSIRDCERSDRITFGNTSTTNCTTSPCAYVRQNGSTFSTPTTGGTGNYGIAYSGYSVAPTCNCSAFNAGSDTLSCSVDLTTSLSAIGIYTRYGTTATNGYVHVQCKGPR